MKSEFWRGIGMVLGDMARIFLLTIFVMPEEQPYLTLLGILFIVLVFVRQPATRITGSLYGFFYGFILSIAMMFYYAYFVRHDSVNVLDVLGLSVVIVASGMVGYGAGLVTEAGQAILTAYRAV